MPQDKEKIAEIVQKEVIVEEQYRRTKEELDREIVLVQKSTRVTFSIFAQIHNHLRSKYSWYYRWHLSPAASVVHWMTLAGFTVSFSAISLVSLMNTNVTTTYASATNIDQDYLASDEAAATFSGSPSTMTVTLNDAAIAKYKWAKSQGATLYFGLKGSVEDVANNYLAIASGSGTRLNIDNGSEYAPLLVQETLPFDWQGGFQVDNLGNTTSMTMRVGQEWTGNVVRAVMGIDLSSASTSDPASLALELVDAEGAPYTGTVHATVFADDTPAATYTGVQLFTKLGTSSAYTPPAAAHTITPSAGTHGSIDPSIATEVANAGNQAFTITPDAGYYIAEIKIDGASQAGVLSSPYTFSNVTADHTIAVTYAANNTRIWDGGDADDDNWNSDG